MIPGHLHLLRPGVCDLGTCSSAEGGHGGEGGTPPELSVSWSSAVATAVRRRALCWISSCHGEDVSAGTGVLLSHTVCTRAFQHPR